MIEISNATYLPGIRLVIWIALSGASQQRSSGADTVIWRIGWDLGISNGWFSDLETHQPMIFLAWKTYTKKTHTHTLCIISMMTSFTFQFFAAKGAGSGITILAFRFAGITMSKGSIGRLTSFITFGIKTRWISCIGNTSVAWVSKGKIGTRGVCRNNKCEAIGWLFWKRNVATNTLPTLENRHGPGINQQRKFVFRVRWWRLSALNNWLSL